MSVTITLPKLQVCSRAIYVGGACLVGSVIAVGNVVKLFSDAGRVMKRTPSIQRKSLLEGTLVSCFKGVTYGLIWPAFVPWAALKTASMPYFEAKDRYSGEKYNMNGLWAHFVVNSTNRFVHEAPGKEAKMTTYVLVDS